MTQAAIHIADANKLVGKDRIVEVVERYKNGKFKSFTKYLVEKNPQNEEIKSLVNNLGNTVKSLESLTALNAVLSAANLCATIAGFAIMNEKLNAVNENIDEIKTILKEDRQLDLEKYFNDVVGEYNRMLNKIEDSDSFTSDEYIKLINNEYSLQDLLIKSFLKYELQEDNEGVLCLIAALSSMICVSIKHLNEKRAEDNLKIYKDDRWIQVYECANDKKFINKMYDLYFIDKNINQNEANILIEQFCQKLLDNKQDILDNIELLKYYDNPEEFKKLCNEIDAFAIERINEELRKNSYSNDTKNQIIQATKDMQFSIA